MITLYYDYEPEGNKRPLWLSVITNKEYWNQPTVYITCSSYDIYDVYDFYDEMYGCSIHLDELVINRDLPGQFGLNIDRLKTRLEKESVDVNLIEKFMIQVVDVVEVLNVNL